MAETECFRSPLDKIDLVSIVFFDRRRSRSTTALVPIVRLLPVATVDDGVAGLKVAVPVASRDRNQDRQARLRGTVGNGDCSATSEHVTVALANGCNPPLFLVFCFRNCERKAAKRGTMGDFSDNKGCRGLTRHTLAGLIYRQEVE